MNQEFKDKPMKRRWRKLVISKMLEYYLISIAFTLLYTIVECSFFYRIKDDAFKIYQPLFMVFFSMINVEIYFLSFLIKEIRKEMFKYYYVITESLIFILIAFYLPVGTVETNLILLHDIIIRPIIILLIMYIIVMVKNKLLKQT